MYLFGGICKNTHEATGPIHLVIQFPFPHFSILPDGHGTSQAIDTLTLIQPTTHSLLESGIQPVVQGEYRPLQFTDFIEGLGQLVLAGISSQLAHAQRSRNPAMADGCSETTLCIPITTNEIFVYFSLPKVGHGLRGRERGDGEQILVGYAANPWRESKAQQPAKCEHVIGVAAGIGVVFLDIEVGLVMAKCIDYMEGLTGVGNRCFKWHPDIGCMSHNGNSPLKMEVAFVIASIVGISKIRP
jgi:hypothetical protein